jgi:hypothetical protein
MAGSTPILDRLAPLPAPAQVRSARAEFVSAIYGAVAGVVIAVALIVWHASGRPAVASGDWIRQWFSATLPGWPIGIRLSIAAIAAAVGLAAAIGLHELGHVVAGLRLGFRFNSMRVGRLQIDRRFHLSWSRAVGRGASGMATLFPVGTDRLSQRSAGMVLGGPAANLVAAGVVMALPFEKGPLFVSFVFWCLILGTMNLVSFRRGSFASDGRRILMLLRDPPQAERWLAILTLNAELSEGVEPEALSPDFIAKAIAVRDDSFDTVSAHVLAYLVRFFQHDDAGAADALEICLRHAGSAPPAIREALMCEAGVFQARRRGRGDLAQAWLADVPPRTELPGIRQQVEAAILEAAGDRAGASRKLDEVETILRDRPDGGQRDLALRLLRRWRSDLTSRAR